MKIYGDDYTFLLDRLNIRNNSQVKVFDNGTKVVQFADKFLEEQRAASQDEVSISREGFEYLRDRLSDFGSLDDRFRYNETGSHSLAAGGGLSLMDGLCRTYILQRLDTEDAEGVSSRLYSEMAARYNDDISRKDVQKLSDYAESLARAYADMRKSITEGHANGTREVWTLDKSTGEDFSGVEFEIDGNAVRYRKLSEEEELQNLDKAFERLTEDAAKELIETKNKELSESGEEMTDEEKEFWNLSSLVSGLLKEIDAFLRRIEAEEAGKKKEESVDFGARLSMEMYDHGTETVSRGMRQVQYENYRKMSKMVADVQTLLGNIRA